MNEPQPITLVIFGASGDLTKRKLIPALYNLFRKGRLPERTNIVGFSRTPYTHDAFRAHLREGVEKYAGNAIDPEVWQALASHLWYSPGDSTTPEDYRALESCLREIEQGPANRIYYLSTAPELFGYIAETLGRAGMARETEGWRCIVIEKPFGTDLASAEALNLSLHSAFSEHQVYRMDHYLGKETAQNLLFFRFANTIFEPLWNRNYVDNVQISVLEAVDVERRGAYYDNAGVLRDMFQNHLLQLLTLITMEPPASFEADAVRNEKFKVLSAISPPSLEDTLRAQYRGYRQAPGVRPDSDTATYAVLRLFIDNWRWQGVPFYLRSGKAVDRKWSEIDIEFVCPPHVIFNLPGFTPNVISLTIQPDEGVHLKFEAKVPDSPQLTRSVNMEFHYNAWFKDQELPDAYERLLLDIMNGDASLFPRNDAIEAAWRLIDPVIQGWATPEAPPLAFYDQGSAGPVEADQFLAEDSRIWLSGCPKHGGEDVQEAQCQHNVCRRRREGRR